MRHLFLGRKRIVAYETKNMLARAIDAARSECRQNEQGTTMPHLILDYSANLDADLDMRVVAQAVHKAALSTGVFPIGGCRTRVARRDIYVIGDGHPDNRYIHIEVQIAAGRPEDVRAKASETIFAALKAETAAVFAKMPLGLSMTMMEMPPTGSHKHNNLHEIIAARTNKA